MSEIKTFGAEWYAQNAARIDRFHKEGLNVDEIAEVFGLSRTGKITLKVVMNDVRADAGSWHDHTGMYRDAAAKLERAGLRLKDWNSNLVICLSVVRVIRFVLISYGFSQQTVDAINCVEDVQRCLDMGVVYDMLRDEKNA